MWFRHVLDRIRGLMDYKKENHGTVICQNDFILASYPKSGNTWLRFLLANIYNSLEHKFNEIDFHTVHEVIPELKQHDYCNYHYLPKVFKTHETYEDSFKNVILILRNPLENIDVDSHSAQQVNLEDAG